MVSSNIILHNEDDMDFVAKYFDKYYKSRDKNDSFYSKYKYKKLPTIKQIFNNYVYEKYQYKYDNEQRKIVRFELIRYLFRLMIMDKRRNNNLIYMNNILTFYGYHKELTKKEAKQSIKDKLTINIYDVMLGNYNIRHNSIKELREYSKSKQWFCPLHIVKNLKLDLFLKYF